MKRQETLRSSSSKREALSIDHRTVNHAANSVGCMAGVFQLISSKYRTRRRFLTFGRKQQEKQTMASSSPQQSKPKSPARKSSGGNRDHFDDNNAKNGFKEDAREFRRLSCEMPRSPIIPPEIRRSNSLDLPESFRSPVPSVVARLMGLEEGPAPAMAVARTSSPPKTPESAVEKRRKLLGALEKCDEDLQALKRIIEAVHRSSTPAPPSVSVGRGAEVVAMKKCTDQISGIVEQEQPSPVSVLEDFTESPPSSFAGGWNSSKRTRNEMCRVRRVTPQQQQRKKPGEDSIEISSFCFHDNIRFYVTHSLFHPKSILTATISPPRSSTATMEEAVNEVCRDVEMGQKREIERIGAVVEDFIYRDLIEEITKEFMGCCHVYSSLPFEKCKRKLRF